MDDAKKAADDLILKLRKRNVKREQCFMVPVGSCPICGSPVYAPKQIVAGQPIQTQRSCQCQPGKSITDQMRTT